MALMGIQDMSVGFGRPYLLENVNLQVEPGERIALMGRNGVGKTTLLRAMNFEIYPDEGSISPRQDLRTAMVSQQVPDNITGKVYDIAADGLFADAHLEEPGHLPGLIGSSSGVKLIQSAGQRSSDVSEASEAWRKELTVDMILSRLSLAPEAEFESLSAGLKRQVLLARAAAFRPDILFLDEPTNHLDIDAVCRLEEFLSGFGASVVFVSHDRMFVRNLASRIIEIYGRTLINWNCDYDTFMERKDKAMQIEDRQWEQQDRRMAEEEAWIRRGVKARRKRNQGRVKELIEMRKIRRERFERTGTARMRLQEAERSGKLAISAENVSFSYGEKPLIKNFSTTITRGDRIGIIGPNGCGKTTLLKLLLKTLDPDEGTVSHGTRLEIGYFDQLREQLDDEKSLADNIVEGADVITVNGKPRQLLAYLIDFLFTPEQSRYPVKILSGGERNRLMLAKLFARPSNLLVLDEPTNDLDMETAELLEELLQEYKGTVLTVSHDREFLNNLATSTLVFEDEGTVNEYVGGYDDWLRQRRKPKTEQTRTRETRKANKETRKKRPSKLSYKQQKELETLPMKIENLEQEKQQLYAMMSDVQLYKNDARKIADAKKRLQAIEKEINENFNRWEELESLQQTLLKNKKGT